MTASVAVLGSYRRTIGCPVTLLSGGDVLPIVLVAGHVLVEDGALARPRAACRCERVKDLSRQLPLMVQRAKRHMKAPLLDQYNHMHMIRRGVF